MAGLLSGLAGLGLDQFADVNIFDDADGVDGANAPRITEASEKDFLYEKSMECPVCGKMLTTKIVKSGKNKLLGTDQDFRPRYEGLDVVKYDVILCTHCGYAGLSRYFMLIAPGQGKMIRDNISKNVKLNTYSNENYSYDEALERYRLALACAIVKKAKASEKAYICLKSAWLVRGYAENINQNEEDKVKELKALEEEYLANAFSGFAEARRTESFPMCGMDAGTIDLLLAVLTYELKRFDVSSKLVANLLVSSANPKTKEKARELKEQLMLELKKQTKQENQ